MVEPSRPPTLASISSKTRTLIRSLWARMPFSASMIRLNSPPEAIFRSGWGGWPGLVWAMNST